jgi:hypothetical protein
MSSAQFIFIPLIRKNSELLKDAESKDVTDDERSIEKKSRLNRIAGLGTAMAMAHPVQMVRKC